MMKKFGVKENGKEDWGKKVKNKLWKQLAENEIILRIQRNWEESLEQGDLITVGEQVYLKIGGTWVWWGTLIKMDKKGKEKYWQFEAEQKAEESYTFNEVIYEEWLRDIIGGRPVSEYQHLDLEEKKNELIKILKQIEKQEKELKENWGLIESGPFKKWKEKLYKNAGGGQWNNSEKLEKLMEKDKNEMQDYLSAYYKMRKQVRRTAWQQVLNKVWEDSSSQYGKYVLKRIVQKWESTEKSLEKILENVSEKVEENKQWLNREELVWIRTALVLNKIRKHKVSGGNGEENGEFHKNTSAVNIYSLKPLNKLGIGEKDWRYKQEEKGLEIGKGKDGNCEKEEACMYTILMKNQQENKIGDDNIIREIEFDEFIYEYNRHKKEGNKAKLRKLLKTYLSNVSKTSEHLIPEYKYQRGLHKIIKSQEGRFKELDQSEFLKEIELVLDETVSKGVKIELLGSIEDKRYVYVIDKEKPFDIKRKHCKVATVENWKLKDHELPYGIVCVKEDGRLEIFDKGWVE